jgi:ACS family tartrate transporter-like MFS transporter
MLAAIYFGVPASVYGVTLWLPSAIRSFSGLGYFSTGMVAAMPYLVTAAAMVLVGRHSDLAGERRWHTALPGLLGAVALLVAAYGGTPVLVIAGMGLGMLGAQSMLGPFWAMATSRLSGTAAAAGIAVINSVGNLGGYFGPYIIGWARSDSGNFRGGLLAVGVVLAMSAGLAPVVGSNRARMDE